MLIFLLWQPRCVINCKSIPELSATVQTCHFRFWLDVDRVSELGRWSTWPQNVGYLGNFHTSWKLPWRCPTFLFFSFSTRNSFYKRKSRSAGDRRKVPHFSSACIYCSLFFLIISSTTLICLLSEISLDRRSTKRLKYYYFLWFFNWCLGHRRQWEKQIVREINYFPFFLFTTTFLSQQWKGYIGYS